MLKYSINIGAILGIAFVAIELISNLLGMENNLILTLISYTVLAVGIIYGIKSYRDGVMEGHISYGSALKLGVMISLFASILLASYIYINYTVFDTQLIEELLDKGTEEIYNDENLTDEQIEMSVKFVSLIFQPGVLAILAFFSNTFLGLIFSLIISAFLKNPAPLFEDEA